MTFDEMVAEVYTLTNRPDLEAETKQAVRASTLKMHTVDFFHRDIMQTQLVFTDSLYIQQIDTTIFDRWRAAAFIRKWDQTLNPQSLNPMTQPWLSDDQLVFFKPIDPNDIFDSYDILRQNVYYAAGDVLNLKSPVAFQTVLMGFYQLPDVAEGSYSSWIAIKQPFAIIYDATSKIFATTGQQEQSRKYDDPKGGIVTDEIMRLKASFVLPNGY